MLRMPTFMRSDGMALRRLAGLLAAASLLVGCTSHVTVASKFPRALVEPLPVSVGIVFDKKLKQFVHNESIPNQSSWSIEVGKASIAMLSPLFQSMFAKTRMLAKFPGDPAALAGLDGVLRPELEKYEFDVPVGQHNAFVEVWMQYRLNLYKPSGELVAAWPVSGYGKAELSHKKEQAVNQASVEALRDVGASISTKFAQQPKIAYWLQETKNAAALSAKTQSF